MARIGISFEQVAAAADTLLSNGKQPTIHAVRELLGTGSPNTIHRHLSTYNDSRPQVAQVAVEVPAELTAAFLSALDRTAAAARAEKENQIVTLKAAADELSAAGEALENERDALAEQVLALTTDRDRLDAIAAERQTELERQAADLVTERHNAEQARIEVAQFRNKLDLQKEKLQDDANELVGIRLARETLQKEKNAAEQAAAVALAQLEASAVRHSDLSSRFEALYAEVKEATTRAKSAEQSLASERMVVHATTARLEAATREITAAQEFASTARAAAKISGEEAAELRGQLAALSVLKEPTERKPAIKKEKSI